MSDLNKPLSDAELDAWDDLLHTLAERADLPISLEFVDGFAAALACGPRRLEADAYWPVLLGEGGLAICADASETSRLTDSFARRLREIERALAAPVDNLGDPKALSPFILDWDSLLDELPPAQRADIDRDDVPPYGQLWAEGFLVVVDSWPEDWALPAASKDEAFVDASLDPFYTLTTAADDWTDEERKISRDEHVARAIWSLYDLRDFWLDRGIAPSAPIRVEATPGRNDECACGSGKKYKKCCGAN